MEMKAGVIVYDIVNGVIGNGKWAHEKMEGKLSRETMTKISGEGIAGVYNVEIFVPGGSLIFYGTVTVTPTGEVFYLRWDGMEGTKKSAFVGVGFVNGQYLAATFERES